MKYMAITFYKYKKSPFLYLCACLYYGIKEICCTLQKVFQNSVIIFFSPGRAVTTVLTGKGSYPQSWDSHVDFWATQEAQHSHF